MHVYNIIIIFADIGGAVLELCHRNINRNCPTLSDEAVNVSVRELDWLKPFHSSTNKFQWTSEDMDMLKHTTHIIAADGIIFFNCPFVHFFSSNL